VTPAFLRLATIEGFARRCGISNLFLQGNKVRFEINMQAANGKGLKINAQIACLGNSGRFPDSERDQ